jgi:hypothetical protein
VTRRLLVVVALLVVLVASACEMRVEVAVDVRPDGSGVVEVAVGFDEAALARLGDPAQALATGDLSEAGWQVDGPALRDDGLTWLTATRTFVDPDDFALVIEEVSGPQGPLAGSRVEVDRGWVSTTTGLTGVVDLSDGLAPFTDDALTEALGGQPFGGLDAAIEADEGRPVADMVDIVVRWSLDGQEVEQSLTLGDGPQVVELETRRWTPGWWLVAIGAALGGVAVAVVVAQRRTAVRHRRTGSAPIEA